MKTPPPDNAPAPDAPRLQKILADAGVASRRHAETLIAAGRVTVDGRPVPLGTRVDPALHQIAVDGHPLRAAPQPRQTWLVDKPAGVICTASDPQQRTTVFQWAARHGLPPLRFFTVGRLDYDTEGLLLLTTDGPLAQRLAHPSHHVEKEYLALLPHPPSPSQLHQIIKGVRDRGELLRALSARPDPENPCVLDLVLGEGRNRHIRRMLGALDLPVLRLRRIRIGPLSESLLRGRPLLRLPPSALP